MLFNSLDFAVFLPIVFIIYWLIPKKLIQTQYIVLLLSSYVFYGWWDYRFLTLIAISSIIDFILGKAIYKEKKKPRRKRLLFYSLFMNLGFLGFFKYYNFFIDSFTEAFSIIGYSFSPERLNIILPVGISFYTFQTLSYSIDIYRNRLKPTNNPIAFFAFVSFFPQLVAGPIERARNLLPQFKRRRFFSYQQGITGLHEIAWGLFKKIVIADNLAFYTNSIYSDPTSYEGLPLIWATLFFAIQIYCDFSGYSSIAIGTARLFGFHLMTNFKRPYFSEDFQEFWGRWHISLSSWFRDYVYIPLGGNRVSKLKVFRNIMVTFTLSGLWHGANWTFIIWGVLHGLFTFISRSYSTLNLHSFIKVGLTFILTMLAWVFFRADTLGDAFYILVKMFDFSTFQIIGLPTITIPDFLKLIVFSGVLFIIDLIAEYYVKKDKELLPGIFKIIAITILLLSIYMFGAFEEQEFIYFQF